MLRQRTFLKKTRRGKVIKVVREHYLRDDIVDGRKAQDGNNEDEVRSV